MRYFMLECLYLDNLISGFRHFLYYFCSFHKSVIYWSLVQRFESLLDPHQLSVERKAGTYLKQNVRTPSTHILFLGEKVLHYNVIEHNILCCKQNHSEFTFTDMSRCFENPQTEVLNRGINFVFRYIFLFFVQLRSIASRMIVDEILNSKIENNTLYFSGEP